MSCTVEPDVSVRDIQLIMAKFLLYNLLTNEPNNQSESWLNLVNDGKASQSTLS